ncbi:MAG: ATP-binding protein [Nonlabens sp.]|uniref:ATP-binding protein n=1 Tax=Nonlabens sp. TaxID=1888209 RepID=UPI003EF62FD5
MCLAQSDDDSSLSIDSQEIAVDAMQDKARMALQKTDYLKAQKIINGAVEIAKDSVLYAHTQLLQAEYHLINNQTDIANSKIAKIEHLIPAKSIDQTRLFLLQATIFLKNKNYVETDQTLNSAKISASQSSNSITNAQIAFLRAQLQLETNNLTEAVNGLRAVIPQLEDQNLHYYKAQATLYLAQAYYKKQEFDEANAATNEVLKTSKQYGFTFTELETYNLKSAIARDQGDYKKGLEYMDRFLELKKSSEFKSEGSNATSINNQEIDSLKKQLAKKQKDLDRHDYTNIMFFVLLTLLSLLTMSLFKNNKFRLRANKTLVVKNKSLIEERDRAQDAAKIKADFLSTITHELRTPMYAVTGLTHLLLENTPRKDQKEHLETLQSSGEYLLSLIDNILNFNKLEANKVELESIPFGLKKRITDLTNSLSSQATDRNNKLQLEFDSAIPSRINGDPVKVSQILINLIGNAIKFTQNGNIWIRANRVKQLDDRCLIRFEVEDNGKGISQEKQEAIFENFAQEESSTTREYGGTGLGLAIVKNLVELMGSDVKLDSKLGRGSIFSFDIWFELPDSNKFYDEYQSNAAEIPETTNTALPVEEEITDNIPAEKTIQQDVIAEKPLAPGELLEKKILVVEDNKINQMITRKILEGKNFTCDVANHGAQALRMVQDKEYDLILMDIHMPVMDGKQATREIRKINREIPIIALTAVTLNDSEKELYEIGFDDIIPKPFKIEEFFGKIQKAFTNYQVL